LPSLLPTRPNAHLAYPEVWNRWNAMFHDTGPRNLTGQRLLHAEMCDANKDCRNGKPIGNVHDSPDFVLWHRAFLYYHEQILSALGSDPVGLPYWDWSLDLVCPPAYTADKFKFGDHLYRSENELGDEFGAKQVAATVAALRSMPPADAAMELFQEPIHMFGHACLGWDHENDLMTAAGDPLFYGHHGNLDRLATHIFQNGWPAPSGISYHFIGSDGKPVCTTLDQFATMPSPYEGDHPIDTSGYSVTVVDGVTAVKSPGYDRVRTKLRSSVPQRMGIYQVLSGSGTRLGQIASIDHHGMSDFIVWLTVENYNEARTHGIKIDHGDATLSISRGLRVTQKV
jgi:hypothetical protein